MKLSACVAALALAFSAAHAWTFDASDVAPPGDIVGEHQPLQRSWTISSFAQLEQLYLALPGRVFVELDPSLLPTPAAPKTEAPTDRPGVVAGFTPGVRAGFTPGVEPGFVPGEALKTGEPATTATVTEAPKTEGATHRPGVVAGFTPGVQSGVTPGAEPGFVPGEVPAGANTEAPATTATETGAPSSNATTTDRPGVVAGFTPGVRAGFTPGVEPGFVPGEALKTGEPATTATETEAPKTEGATHRPGVVAGFTPGVQSGVTPGAEPGFVPGEVVKTGAPATTVTETESPKADGAATDRPGVVAGFTPGVRAGFTPGVEPGFVPGEALKTGEPATTATETEAPKTEGATHRPGVVAGFTPGVQSGVTPGAEPGFVPGEVPAGANTEAPATTATETEAPKTEGVATDRPGVVGGFTPGVQSGVTPGAEPGFVPGEVPAGSAAAQTRALATVTAETEGLVVEGAATQRPGVVAGFTPGVQAGFTPGVEPGFIPGEAVKSGEPATTATKTEAAKAVGAATKRPGVVAGFTPGVQAGFTPGVEPGFIPGEAVKSGEPATTATKTEAAKAVGAATKRPGVVAGFTPGVQAGFTPGVEPGFIPGEAVKNGKPATTATKTEAAKTEGAGTQRPGVVAGYTPGVETGVIPGAVPGFVPGAVPAGKTIEVPSMMLRKRHHRDEDTEEDEPQGEETIVARIVITGNSTDLLNMIEASPLHPRRNDGLKLHLKNQDAYGEGYVLTKIYLFEKNLLRRVTTAFSGDVVLNDDVVTLDDAEADLKFACVGDGNLFLDSGANATLASLEVEVTGNGLAQLAIPSVSLASSLYVEVAGSGTVALVTDALAANAVKTTLSGSGNVVVDTSDLTAQKLEAAVYGSGVASFATAGSVDKESLTLSGPGQLLAGSIVARKSSVDVWGDGEMLVQATDRLTVATSVWGKVGYVNAPPTDVKIKGWWFWREASAIVYPAVVNKVVIYEPASVPAKSPVFYSIETAESALSDDPDYAFVSSAEALATVADVMTTSLSNVKQASASTDSHGGFFYAFAGAGVVVVNVVAARSWAQRRARRHYTRLP